MVGTVEQEFREHVAVARREARAQARRARALGQRRERDQARIALAAEGRGGGERAQRRLAFLEVDLAVALVGDDHEAVAVGKLEEALPLLLRHHAPVGVRGRAGDHEARLRPHRRGDRVPVGPQAVRGERVHEVRARAGEQRGALVDLVERVRAEHPRVALVGIESRLHQREERFLGAVHREHLRRGIHRLEAEAARDPRGDGLAQPGLTCRGGVAREAAEVRGHRLLDEVGRGVLGLAQAEADGGHAGGRRDAGEQAAQAFEGVGLEQPEAGIHPPDFT